MIRHRPEGRGHAYLVEPDQRVPVHRSRGEPLELRATTGGGVSQLWPGARASGSSERIDALRVQRVPAAARTAGEATHLSVAADGSFRGSGRREGRARRSSTHTIVPLPLRRRRRLVHRWHTAVAAAWIAEGGVPSS